MSAYKTLSNFYLCLPLLLQFCAVGFVFFYPQGTALSSLPLFGSLDSPWVSFASEPIPTFSGVQSSDKLSLLPKEVEHPR